MTILQGMTFTWPLSNVYKSDQTNEEAYDGMVRFFETVGIILALTLTIAVDISFKIMEWDISPEYL